MDLTDPTRSITPTLDGPILAVLAATGRPLTVGDVAARVPRGSEIGVRKALSRLVEQGIVTSTRMGRNLVHELNREHLAAPAAEALADLRLALWKRIRDALAAWKVKPTYACVFGSAARHDGGPESDIDLLLVHPNLPGDPRPSRRDKGLWAAVNDLMLSLASQAPVPGGDATWHSEVDELRGQVQRWTGNSLQVLDISFWQWIDLRNSNPALFEQISHESVTMAGQPFHLSMVVGPP